MLLPPYDTAATLAKLGALVARYAPRFVVALGDSFHDGGGPERVSQDDRAMLGSLQRGRDWIWIAGNHDPEPVRDLGGVSAAMFGVGPLVFRHAPEREDGRRRDRRPPASGGARQRARPHGVAPLLRHRRQAHGDAGVRRLYRRAQYPRCRFADVFGTLKFTAHMLGEARIYAIAAQRCLRRLGRALVIAQDRKSAFRRRRRTQIFASL